MERIIDLGKYIEIGINALEENFSFLWSAMDEGITWIVDSINSLLLGTPFIVFLIIVDRKSVV